MNHNILLLICLTVATVFGYFLSEIYDRFFDARLKSLENRNRKLETEMSDRREIERELAHMASFADMAPNSIIETDAAGVIGYVNPAAESEFPGLKELGKDHALLEGLEPITELLTREGRSLLTRPVRVGERIYDQRVTLLDSRRSRLRLYMTDITELKRLDQLKTDFVNMVSHELRSPLTTIAASIQMVASGMMGSTNSEQGEALQMAKVNIDRLARMINDLLDVSKIEAGKLELRRARVDLAGLIEEVCRSFEPLARERGLQIRRKLPPLPVETIIDRDKILQVFINLMNNALKFTSQGYVEISAEIQNKQVQCRVADTGPGILPEDLPKVFSKFAQFGSAPVGREKGTGLGLSLCKGFVELHGGKIWVESRWKEGTQFVFSLPNVEARDLFQEYVKQLLGTLVAEQKSLSLFRVTLSPWQPLESAWGPEKSLAAWNQFASRLQTLVGVEPDSLFQDKGTFLLALPDVTKSMAADIATRIRTNWQEIPFDSSLPIPLTMDIHTASFPEESNVLEQLFSSLDLKAA